MIIFGLLLLSWIAADLAWWRRTDVRLRRLHGQWFWRPLLGAFALFQAAYISWVLVWLPFGEPPIVLPVYLLVLAYVWHILLLPVALLIMFGPALSRRIIGRWTRRGHRVPAPADAQRSTSGDRAAVQPRVTRRQVLGAAVAAVPPLIAVGTAVYADAQQGQFGIRRVVLPIPGLPADLDGLSIAHVSDLHIGKFLPTDAIPRVAEAINAFNADLVVFTGDLIDQGTLSNLGPGVEFIKSLRPYRRLVMIEGNHDVLADAETFERAIQREAGLPLLLDEARTLDVGRKTRVQLLGITWGAAKLGSELGKREKYANKMFREQSETATADSVRRVNALREPDAFPILLAHHPHAFDTAVELDLPLTLSGHTHGGQLMLTKNIGAGPLRFRYWTGAYRKASSHLFVSNGVGNWFPLRINAPAEIAQITLRRA